MKNIVDVWIKTRCIKDKIICKNKVFNVYIIKDCYAKVIGNKIIIDDNFLKYPKNIQFALLYHEEYHLYNWSNLLKFIWNVIKFKSIIKARWEEEYNADIYSSKKTSKKDVISFLKKAKKEYDKGNIKYNPKTHPLIEDRINRVLNN